MSTYERVNSEYWVNTTQLLDELRVNILLETEFNRESTESDKQNSNIALTLVKSLLHTTCTYRYKLFAFRER